MVVVSSINGDITLKTRTYPAAGETVLATRSGPSLGGKGANVAVAASRSGLAPCRLAGAVGSDGAALVSTLQSLGVETSLVQSVESEETGAAYVILDEEGGNSIVVVQGANSLYKPDDKLGEAMRDAVVVLQLEIDGEVTREVAREAKKVGASVVLNPSPVPGEGDAFGTQDCAWGFVDVAVVNEIECGKLAGVGEGELNVADAAEVLRGRCAEGARVVVTLGGKGVVIADGEGEVKRVPAVRVDQVVDTTGAGDTLTGYLAAGVAGGMEFERAVREAVVAAGICVQRQGAALAIPDGAEVRRQVVAWPDGG